jgi:hypothetical protein
MVSSERQFGLNQSSDSDPSTEYGLSSGDESSNTSTTRTVEIQRSVLVEQQVQQNYGTIAGIVENVRRMLDYHELTDCYVKRCVKEFASPPGIGEADEILRRNHIVVLVAEADSGRHDAAVFLLRNREGVTLREVRREPGDRLDIAALGVEARSGWLLDLRNDRELDLSFGRSLLGERERLRSQGSYLVVVIPPSLWTRVGIGGGELTFSLTPAAAYDIVRSRLRALDPPIDAEPYLEAAEVKKRLYGATPAEAKRWVDAIREVNSVPPESQYAHTSDQLSPADEIQTLIRSVIQVCENWRPQLLQWHKQNPDSRLRNFLLAAAVLEGRAAGDVFDAATQLAIELGEAEPNVKGQCGAGILELVDRVGAHLPDEECVRFTRPGYADAILDYFWIDRQHLQTRFVTWMGQLPLGFNDRDAAEAISNRISSYILRWTIRHRKLKLLRTVVWRWAPERSLRTTLVYLVTAAALRPDAVGKLVRDELLDWAKTEGDDSLAVRTLTAEVCGDALARIYPKVALYRLAILAQSADPPVVEAVKNAIQALWQKASIRDHIIDQVSMWCDATDATRREAGLNAFLALAGLQESEYGQPELSPLLSGATSDQRRKLLEQGWRAVLSAQSVDLSAGDILAVWLDAALLSTELQTLLKEVLAVAICGAEPLDTDYRRFVRLSSLLFWWQPARQSTFDRQRADLRDAILWHVHQSNPTLKYLDTGPTDDSDTHVAKDF